MGSSLLKNKYFYACLAVAFLLTRYLPSNINDSFFNAVPTIIGILVGAVFTSVVIILGMITSKEIVALGQDARQTVEKQFPRIRSHLLLLVSTLIISFFAAYWSSTIQIFLPYIIFSHITSQQVAIFIEISCLLLATVALVEIILVVILFVELRWSLLKKELDKNTEVKTIKPVSSQTASTERHSKQ